MKEFIKKLNIYHYICIVITLLFIACSVFLFRDAFVRIIEAGRDFGLSIAYYFNKMFRLGFDINASVKDMSLCYAPGTVTIIPESSSEFVVNTKTYWQLLGDKRMIAGYIKIFLYSLIILLNLSAMLITLGIMLSHFFKKYITNHNNDYNKDSKPLKVLKKLAEFTYIPLKRAIVSFFNFLKENDTYLKIWLFIWLFSFNIITVVLEFIAFLYYLVVSYDFSNIYLQIYKLFLDLKPMFDFVPGWCWILLALIVLDRIRKSIGYARLNHMERMDRGFANSLPIVTYVTGKPGIGKTLTMTDIVLSLEILLRRDAYDLIIKNDMLFPFFPWINFENDIKKMMFNHKIFNLTTCRNYVKKIANRFKIALEKPKYFEYAKKLKWQYSNFCYDYDFNKYGLYYNDNLNVHYLFDVLEEYAQSYLLYIMYSVAVISNYNIRFDNAKIDEGNFPLWDDDFFRKDPIQSMKLSRHANIIDFDMFRLGKKLIEDNKKANFFEFGIVVITEAGKERGNMLDTKELKKLDEECNQKNDNFNSFLKLARHPAYVGHKPFVRFIMDDQRAMSMNADLRELSDIISIIYKSKQRLCMPFFFIEELIYDFVFSKFLNLYKEYRLNRADNTCFMYGYKIIASKIHRYYNKIYNTFSYFHQKILKQDTCDSKSAQDDINNYYLMPKKIYANRYCSAAYGDFFEKRTSNSQIGFEDLEKYKNLKASMDELLSQKSFFINSLDKYMDDKKDKDNKFKR